MPTAVLEDGPGNRLIIKNVLLGALYDPFTKFFDREMEAIAVRNCLIGSYQHRSFVHKTVLYLYDKPQKGAHRTPRLHRELVPKAEDLIKQKHEIEFTERPLVAHYIVGVLMRTSYVGDFFALLPEFLHQPLVDGGLPRGEHPKMTIEEIETFRSHHQRGYELLHGRAMWNLLLSE